MGIGDWGLGIGDWGLGQSPIPNVFIYFFHSYLYIIINRFILVLNNKNKNNE